MAVDVVTEITIDAPRSDVAAYAANPDNVTSWYANIEAVEWRSPKPAVVGSKIVFVARFLGSRLAYTYEVKEAVPGFRFVMSTDDGPFPMETTYSWEDTPDGATRMTLRNRGEPSGLSKLGRPWMVRAMRRANGKDLTQLKRILESTSLPPGPRG
ncbi:MAG TPA: SRPBCC family protein [Acidimicrobiales bacterium]|nr:SRPBCC family protein [Acidimicrobiales bacterium]